MKRGEEAKKSTCFNLYKRNRLEIFEKGDTNKKGKKKTVTWVQGVVAYADFYLGPELKSNLIKLN